MYANQTILPLLTLGNFPQKKITLYTRKKEISTSQSLILNLTFETKLSDSCFFLYTKIYPPKVAGNSSGNETIVDFHNSSAIPTLHLIH